MNVMLRWTLHGALLAGLLNVCTSPGALWGDEPSVDPFRQLEEILPTPTETRNAAGAPGVRYWQQRADYVIEVELDESERALAGRERITYHNFSPDALRYLWLQLDANIMAPDSAANLTATAPDLKEPQFGVLQRLLAQEAFDGRCYVSRVAIADGSALAHTVVGTMLRIDLPQPLEAGASLVFHVDWHQAVNDAKVIRARTGYEHFPKDDNYIFEIAQWFPRLCAYTDVNGWHHKQFIGSGEFTLELGDYKVRITVPSDHIVAATGVLQNPGDVLTAAQRERLQQARTAERPVFVVTPDEAIANEAHKPTGRKTWVFHADNVRDFAFASSRKFIWDAQQHDVQGNPVLAMSFYPKEGEPLWSRYSTQAIIHTLDVYSRFTFAYPYPVAISVNGPVGGMEYPMICFNGPRPEEDGTYSYRTKYGLISVVIHEVGHNYFPMIVNSDERQWTWMDEGLNTFLQFLTEQEWEEGYPSRRGEPRDIVEYMASDEMVPIMTNSESLLQFGNNAYGKPATALNILRETVLGRDLFDFAFREYARRWQFKRPMPSDLFRTLEDASGIDLDWFWRGWFYTTLPVDLAITGVRQYQLDPGDPDLVAAWKRAEDAEQPESLSDERNRELARRADRFPELKDFYNANDVHTPTARDRKDFEDYLARLEEPERELLKLQRHFAVIDFENQGGLVMPLILQLTYDDDSVEELRIPAEIWRQNPRQVSKLLITQHALVSVVLDPRLETADIDLSDNVFPPRPETSRFRLFKEKKERNLMQDQADAEKAPVTPPTVREQF